MEINGAVKKRTQGRQRIDIKKIENLSNRQVTFSKRRVGLFKKASELCILSGAEIAIIVHSLGKRVFTFGHPNVDSVIERFLNGTTSSESNSRALVQNHSLNAPDYNRHYSHVSRELEVEKKRKEAIDESRKVETSGDGFWWDMAVDHLELDELELYMAALEELMKKVNMKANDLMLLQNSSSLGVGVPMTQLNPTIEPFSFDDMLVNQNQNSNYDFGNCIVPSGDFGKYSFDDMLVNQNQNSNYDFGNCMVPSGDFGKYSFDDMLVNQNQNSNYDFGNCIVPSGDFGQHG